MPIVGGLSAQFGMVDEVTFGTYVAPTRFLEFQNETLQQTIARIESSGLRPSRRVLGTDDWLAGKVSCGGDAQFEFQNKGFGLPLKHMMGAIATSQPNAPSFPTVYEHLATVGQIDGKSFTAQVGRTDAGGTTRSFSYLGCKVASWELDCDVDGILLLKLTLDAQSETTAQGLASASYAATPLVPLVWTGGVLSVAGATANINKFSLKGDNQLAQDRYFLQATNPNLAKEQLEAGLRAYTGQFEAEFTDLSAYGLFTAGTVGQVTAFFTGANIAGSFNYALEITLPAVRFDGQTPNVAGDQIIDQSLPFTVLDSAAGSGPVQLKYRTTDATP